MNREPSFKVALNISCDLELWHRIWNLDSINMNHYAKYLDQ